MFSSPPLGGLDPYSLATLSQAAAGSVEGTRPPGEQRYFSGQNFQTKDPLTLTEHSLGGSWFHPRKVFPSAWHWYERSNWQAGRKWLALLCLGQQTGAVFHIELKLLGAASNADNRASWCLSQCKQVFKRSRLFTPAWKHEGWGGINFQLRFMWDLNKPCSNIFFWHFRMSV